MGTSRLAVDGGLARRQAGRRGGRSGLLAGWVVAAVVLLAVCAGVARAYVPLSRHSLLPPFDRFKENSGDRDIKHWKYGGAVVAKENFLRLTPDKQSKRGWIFNTERLEQKNFGMQLRFRISGSGRHLYGDGLALWLTSKDGSPAFEEGMVLGHTDVFTGIGIMFDTFRNVEQGHVHKDISLIASHGEQPVTLDTDRPGCESHYRYYEGADSFDVDNESRVRLWVDNGRISLEVDKYGKDAWKECFNEKISSLGLPSDWQDNVHISLSASTGALADNHDILELKVAEPNKFKHMIRIDEEERDQPAVQIDVSDDLESADVAEHVNDLAFETAEIGKSLQKLQHRMDHQLEKTKLSLEKMMHKLEEREDDAEHRIDELDTARKQLIEQHLDRRLEKLEDTMHDTIEARLALLETRVGIQVMEAAENSSGWKYPLIAIVIFVAAYAAYTSRSLRKLNQRDKLF